MVATLNRQINYFLPLRLSPPRSPRSGLPPRSSLRSPRPPPPLLLSPPPRCAFPFFFAFLFFLNFLSFGFKIVSSLNPKKNFFSPPRFPPPRPPPPRSPPRFSSPSPPPPPASSSVSATTRCTAFIFTRGI